MRYFRPSLAIFLTVTLLAAPVFASNVRRAPTAGTSARHSTKSSTRRSARSTTKSTAKSSKTTSASTAKSSKTTSASHPASAPLPRRSRGQQAIESDRVMQIQQALIREHYLAGDPTGSWDSTTVSAMQKFQADNGWQTRLMPDSRALKKLGLGPDYSGAINARDASFNDPPPISSIPNEQAVGFSAASGVNQ